MIPARMHITQTEINIVLFASLYVYIMIAWAFMIIISFVYYLLLINSAGSIPLASGGVCIIENIGKWRNDQQEMLSKGIMNSLV